MGKGGLIIDVLTGPPKGEPEDDVSEESLDEEAAPQPSKGEAIITGIESQLAELRGLIAGL